MSLVRRRKTIDQRVTRWYKSLAREISGQSSSEEPEPQNPFEVVLTPECQALLTASPATVDDDEGPLELDEQESSDNGSVPAAILADRVVNQAPATPVPHPGLESTPPLPTIVSPAPAGTTCVLTPPEGTEIPHAVSLDDFIPIYDDPAIDKQAALALHRHAMKITQVLYKSKGKRNREREWAMEFDCPTSGKRIRVLFFFPDPIYVPRIVYDLDNLDGNTTSEEL